MKDAPGAGGGASVFSVEAGGGTVAVGTPSPTMADAGTISGATRESGGEGKEFADAAGAVGAGCDEVENEEAEALFGLRPPLRGIQRPVFGCMRGMCFAGSNGVPCLSCVPGVTGDAFEGGVEMESASSAMVHLVEGENQAVTWTRAHRCAV